MTSRPLARRPAFGRPAGKRPVGKRLPALLAAAAVLLLAACETAPVTGRKQLILLPESQAAQMGQAAYTDIKAKTKVSKDPRMNKMVRQVGGRIAAVSGQPALPWEFTVFEDDTPNAFALPGGKVGVNTGLFKVARNEHQLAAVMGHEIGHAIAKHSNERISQQILLQTGLAGLSATGGAQYAEIAAQLATLGIVLPFSRSQESEADEIGLILMAKAGYDPRQAINLWQNFETLGGSRPPEFLSTHPNPGNRIEHLKEIMPKALAIYQANPNRVPPP